MTVRLESIMRGTKINRKVKVVKVRLVSSEFKEISLKTR